MKMKKVTTGFCLPDDLLQWIKARADRDGVSASSVVTVWLQKIRRDEEKAS